ncbi:UNVERIFIED_ORG: hypothetical protein GGI63_005261 [Rhizobium esperanzae]
MKLARIAQNRDDGAEEAVAGKTLEEIHQQQWPVCVAERAAFMAPFEYTKYANHPYNHGPETAHGHFVDTPLRHPSYSAPAVPFYWMLRENMSAIAKEFMIDVHEEREPELGFEGAKSWVQNIENQTALLDCFRAHIKPEASLCFFYAKQVPFVEDAGTRRILIGVGRVLSVSPPQEYHYATKQLSGKLRSLLWELMVKHTIRADFKDGFLLPYHAAIAAAAANRDFDPAEIVAFTPADRLLEFSHASQLVTHDGAIGSLLSCAESLRKAKDILPGPWDRCLIWIDERLGELWTARGPCPGLGSALGAFGLELGNFAAQVIAEQAGDNADPWPLVEKMFSDPAHVLPAHLAERVGITIREKWRRLPDERKALLKLVSRFEISSDQAKLIYVQEERNRAGIVCSDSEILDNPYSLYELTRCTLDPISVWTVDRGVFPPDIVRKNHPLSAPTVLDAGTDARRIRALAVNVLEDQASSGSTVVAQDQVVLAIRGLSIEPACEVDGDLMVVAKDGFGGVIDDAKLASGAPALQLTRLSEVGAVIRNSLERRANGKRLTIEEDWRARLDDHLKRQNAPPVDETEEQARREKTAALKELAEARLSVLIGPAGTGKTTLLSVLCSHPSIAGDGILLLAPTGKARVRMEQSTRDLKLTGYTIAQFLSPHRYDPRTGRYCLSERPTESGARTVMVDEASMLTEEMLGALLQALRGVHRLILIGDPRQLPPIGAGRPFVDIVNRLKPDSISQQFPRVGAGYAELTIQRRQAGEDRDDLRLAQWFSGSPIAPGEDDVFDKVVAAGTSPHVRFVEWKGVEELRRTLIDVLVEELKLDGPDDVAGFDATLGGEPWNDMRFFNARWGDKAGAGEAAENWQVLSPVRSAAVGVPDLNRLIHKQFRQTMIEASRKERNRKFPKPMGNEEIVYGDKVINLVNTDPKLPWNKHRRVYPAKDDPYIANGEIGVAVGYFWKSGKPDYRWKLEVEFSSQPSFKYDFADRDFSEEKSAVLELAYALTVHKSQGSEFGTVFLVLPNPCRLISRELLYTALTRQKDRVIILHQGPRSEFRKYSSDDRSETARRLTNLFVPPSPILVDGRFYEENLIHRTSRGEMVRSKSEVIIADHLASKSIEYAYEQALTIEGTTKYPDFTVEDAASGDVLYWEHCGMLHVPRYRRRWEEKLAWYRTVGILPHDEGGGPRGTLIITRDEPNGSINSAQIAQLVAEVLGG